MMLPKIVASAPTPTRTAFSRLNAVIYNTLQKPSGVLKDKAIFATLMLNLAQAITEQQYIDYLQVRKMSHQERTLKFIKSCKTINTFAALSEDNAQTLCTKLEWLIYMAKNSPPKTIFNYTLIPTIANTLYKYSVKDLTIVHENKNMLTLQPHAEHVLLQKHLDILRDIQGKIIGNTYSLEDMFAIQAICRTYKYKTDPERNKTHQLLFSLIEKLENEKKLHHAEKTMRQAMSEIANRLTIISLQQN